MKLLKWLSVADRFYKIYLDKQLAPFGINSIQHMFLIFLIPLILILPLRYGILGVLFAGPIADFSAFILSTALVSIELKNKNHTTYKQMITYISQYPHTHRHPQQPGAGSDGWLRLFRYPVSGCSCTC